MFDPVAEQRTVGQFGEAVVEGLVLELLLEGLALADVPGVEHDPVHVGVAEQVRSLRLDIKPVSVAMKEAELGQCRPGVVPVAVSAC